MGKRSSRCRACQVQTSTPLFITHLQAQNSPTRTHSLSQTLLRRRGRTLSGPAAEQSSERSHQCALLSAAVKAMQRLAQNPRIRWGRWPSLSLCGESAGITGHQLLETFDLYVTFQRASSPNPGHFIHPQSLQVPQSSDIFDTMSLIDSCCLAILSAPGDQQIFPRPQLLILLTLGSSCRALSHVPTLPSQKGAQPCMSSSGDK